MPTSRAKHDSTAFLQLAESIMHGNQLNSENGFARLKAKYDRAYTAGKPLISDSEYDAFLRKFRRKYPKAEALQEVGASIGSGERERLPIVVGSLDLCRPSELAAWMRGIEKQSGKQIGWLIEPKIDGVSTTLRYRGTLMRKAWSRGKIIDGVSMGYDITKAMRFPEGAISRLRDCSVIDVSDDYLVRGEMAMHRSIFKQHYLDDDNQADLVKTYRNARNMVSGLLNRDDSDAIRTDLRRCTFIALQLFRKDSKGVWRRPSSAHKEWVYLTLMGFTTALNPVRYSQGHWNLRRLVKEGHECLRDRLPVHELGGSIGELAYWDHAPTEAEVVERMQAIHKVVDIACDGIVVQPIDNKVFQNRGEHLERRPAFIRAVKLDVQDQESFEGKVGEIQWRVTKRGIVMPRLVLAKSIETESATIDHATCNNAAFVNKWGLRPGRRLKMIRSGDVIPRIVAVRDGPTWVPLQVKVGGKWRDERGIHDPQIKDSIPTRCPECNTRLRWTDSDTNLYCPNEDCPGRHNKNVVSFFRTLGVDDVAEKTVLDLMANGMNTVAKIVHGATPRRLMQLEGYAARKAEIVSKAVSGALKGVPLSKVMHASGCFADEATSLGSTRLQSIVECIGEGSVARASPNEIRSKLSKLHGVGARTVDLFIDGLEPWREFFAELKSVYTPPSGPKTLAGVKACWTGFREPEAEKFLIARGGTVKSSVTRDTNVLFAASMGSGKAKRADELQITVVPQNEMWSWLKERSK